MKNFIFLLVFFSLLTATFAQQWQNLGPHNGNGPAVRSLLQHPSNPDILYAGTNGEGVFKSYNKGDSWDKVSQDLIPGDISALAVLTTNPEFLYVGSSVGRLFKSTNGGDSWINISGNLPEGQIVDIQIIEGSEKIYVAMKGASPGRGLYVSDDESNWFLVSQEFLDTEVFSLEINPDNPEIMFASVKTGYLSGNLYRTVDGGVTWDQILSNLIVDIELDPNNSEKLIAVGHSEIIYISEDSGVTWYEYFGFQNIQYFYAVAFSKSNSDELLLSGDNSGLGPSVYRSTTGGYGWSGVEIGGDFSFYFSVLYDWEDGSNAWIGSPTGLYKSTDGGENWSVSIVGMQRISVSSILIKSNNPEHWVIDTDMGIQVSENYGHDWDLRFNWCKPLVYVPESDTLFGVLGEGSYSDGLYRSTNDGYNWTVVDYMMNPRDLKISHTFPRRLYIIFTSSIYRSDDGGYSWTGVSGGITESPIKDLVIDQNQPDMMYVITPTNVWKTTTGSSGWLALSGPFDVYHPICMALDPNNGEHLYIGTEEVLLISEDGGLSWANRSMPAEGLRQLSLSAEYQGFVVAGYDSEGVFYSLDDGLNWTEMNEGLQNQNIRSMAISPGSEFLLCGTQRDGIYQTNLTFVGMDEHSIVLYEEEINIYPQPASDHLIIDCEPDIEKVEIFGMDSARYIVSKNSSIDVSCLAPGMYLIKITTIDQRKIAVKKFVKL